MRLLVVEDDRHMLDILTTVLTEEKFEVISAENGTDAELFMDLQAFDLIILDLMLPEVDGMTLLRRLRKGGNGTPVLILTAKDAISSKVEGLDTGADDYLVKPFSTDELFARIRALLRRTRAFDSDMERVEYGRLSLSPEEYDAYCGDTPLQLTQKEYELLAYFVLNKEQILRREQIFSRVWGMFSEASETAVDLYVHYLRKKLAGNDCAEYIRTVRGVGYMLKADENHV